MQNFPDRRATDDDILVRQQSVLFNARERKRERKRIRLTVPGEMSEIRPTNTVLTLADSVQVVCRGESVHKSPLPLERDHLSLTPNND